MSSSTYMEVAVTLPVAGPFTYEIPSSLAKDCLPGMRVLVPFGRRRITGYILGPVPQPKGYKTKKIIEVLDDHPLFPESEKKLFKWVADYYLHPLGEVIKTALPGGLDRRDVSHVFLTDSGQAALDGGELAPGEAWVAHQLASRESMTFKQLAAAGEKAGHPSVRSLTKRMESQDLIRISMVLKREAASARMEKFLSPGPIPREGSDLRMSQKRRRILDLIQEHQSMSLALLKESVPTAPKLIKPLAQAGLVAITEKRVFRDPLGDPVDPDTPPELTPEQAVVVERVESDRDKGFVPYLLHGVTGSGKTEVYMRLAAEAVDQGKNAMILVPEIALISQTERRFRARFGERIAVLHSMLTHGERLDQWRRIGLGKVQIVIGARSAVFAPFDSLGMIIVDEEHDGSYKQESGLRYNARDLAVVRAKMENCPVILGSATPSLQSYQNVVAKRFELLSLTRRVNNSALPEITLVDLKKYKDVRGYDRVITPELARAIRACLESGNQALIFLNRRGFSTYPACKSCETPIKCRFCDVTMTLHRSQDHYRCHLCGFCLPLSAQCPECGGKKIQHYGFGTEKIETLLKGMFPDARLARMDQDSTAKKGESLKLLKAIRNRTVDIIVGTQMLAKGHDFPSITLVGVICADLSLNLPDFRAGERTFQLLAQVAGRAGRGAKPGRVIMQTYTPDHFTIEASVHQDHMEFFNQEAPFRKALGYPPFTRMIQLKISGKVEQKVADHAQRLADVMKQLMADDASDIPVDVLGPIEASIARISDRFRWQILLKSPSAGRLKELVQGALAHADIKGVRHSRIAVDVDPYSLL
ncbi:MAG: primosomal protein N' [Desulfobacterales bacterium]|nr:primosomal protein N' [Desulfobacterales bacterium]